MTHAVVNILYIIAQLTKRRERRIKSVAAGIRTRIHTHSMMTQRTRDLPRKLVVRYPAWQDRSLRSAKLNVVIRTIFGPFQVTRHSPLINLNIIILQSSLSNKRFLKMAFLLEKKILFHVIKKDVSFPNGWKKTRESSQGSIGWSRHCSSN